MEFIAVSKCLTSAISKVPLLAVNSLPCLITGEDGTGKTHLAKIIHLKGPRAKEPFVIFDILKMADPVKALFGCKNRSILGIDNITSGAIDNAKGGTLFIKNLQAMPLELQLQMIALVELGGYRPANSEEILKARCRFIFTTPLNPDHYINKGGLLPELLPLFSRNTTSLTPLRMRVEDILPLAEYFTKKWCNSLNIPVRTLSKQTTKLLKKSTWRGNTAELQTLLLFSILNFDSEIIEPKHLQTKIDGNWQDHTLEQLEETALEDMVEKKLRQFIQRLGKYDIENLHKIIIERVERPLLKLVMEKSNNNQLKAAKMLGINRNTLRTKLQKMELL